MFKVPNNIILVFVLVLIGFNIQYLLLKPTKKEPKKNIKSPNYLQETTSTESQDIMKTKKLNDKDLKANTSNTKANEVRLIKIALTKPIPEENPKTSNESMTNSRNSFSETYQTYAKLEFLKGETKKYQIDFSNFRDKFISIGFIVNKGEITSPRVSIKYKNGASEEIKIYYDKMFTNDWVKLETNPDLEIDNILVTASSPNVISVFSFYIQKEQ